MLKNILCTIACFGLIFTNINNVYASKNNNATTLSLTLEPGISVPLTSPQSQLFNVGGMVSIKLHIDLSPYIDVGPTLGFVGLPASSVNSFSKDIGMGYMAGGGFRLKRPHSVVGSNLHAVSPWVDADALYVRTGPLNRFGFTVGTGVSFPLDEKRMFWLGPFIRYLQITQPYRENYDNRDAKILTIGLSLEVGSPHKPHIEECIQQVKPTEHIIIAIIQQSTPPSPVAQPVAPVVLVPDPSINEIKTRIQFAWDQFQIGSEWIPVLDKMVAVLSADKSLTVDIRGHASSEGLYRHNLILSTKRAQAVYDYFVAHGIEKRRLTFKGFSSSVPIDDNASESGREANRRADFEQNQIKESK